MSRSATDEAEKLGGEFNTDFASKSALVTGGAGFLGSWLCDALVASGANVYCVDNLSTGKLENVRDFQSQGKITIGDVESVELLGDFDFVFHFASRASPEEYQTRPIETLSANSAGTLRMLRYAAEHESVMVFASSSEVYGDAKVVPTPESYFGNVNPTGVRSCYDEGKRFGEALCMAYYRQERTKVRIARIFNSYGHRIRRDGIYARALPRFIGQALANMPLTIYGSGAQTRSFCYVTDTVRGILRLAKKPGLDGEVINIGNTEEVTIVELARTIIEKTASESELKFMPPVPDDPMRRCPDISVAKKLLSWQPEVTLETGLDRLIAQRDLKIKASRSEREST